MKRRLLTIAKLEASGACADAMAEELDDLTHGSCRRFKSVFGSSVILTEAIAAEHANEFNFDWAARWLLSESALARYEREIEPIRQKYFREHQKATKPYSDALAMLKAKHGDASAAADAEFTRICESFGVERDLVIPRRLWESNPHIHAALTKFQQVTAPHVVDFQEVVVPALNESNRATEAVMKEFRHDCALMFARCYLDDDVADD